MQKVVCLRVRTEERIEITAESNLGASTETGAVEHYGIVSALIVPGPALRFLTSTKRCSIAAV
jgi:hypothetical protein